MGRIKTTTTKRAGIDMFQNHKDKFTTDFDKNKEALVKVLDIPSKKFRNIIAGYVTRLMKEQKD